MTMVADAPAVDVRPALQEPERGDGIGREIGERRLPPVAGGVSGAAFVPNEYRDAGPCELPRAKDDLVTRRRPGPPDGGDRGVRPRSPRQPQRSIENDVLMLDLEAFLSNV